MTSKDEKRTKISLVDTKNHILESYSGIPHPKPSSSFSQLHSINKSLGFLSIKTTSSNIFQSNLKPQSYEFTETGKRKLNTYFSSSCKNRFLLNQNVTNPFLSKEETRDEDKYFSLKFTSIKRNLSLTSLEEDTHNIFTQKYHSSKIHKKDDDDDYEMPKYKFESLCFENVSKDEFVKEILMLDLVKEEEEKLKV
ncbi:uncharacterized protein LOC111612563 [Centruroides sculpturatus]|uniref:uncharacterized protein LOC111612563 n=1 Tax=Centruroides sculpturatus TaxID=218467 RepID=UPI000C6DA15D|nr:uncharacterized protein LOC111612563 [Centruroides sculpturatus]XP_023209560.1 uncharacterized protein LOC111612563 [Centruroides sculpturatus]XP_023209561.1 uncharacterized protein LOC111612563 [Centruroides sculpturatus]XP_023209562.1 uncharacterized protein LOC111612563 [Centruroides sculpturatus]